MLSGGAYETTSGLGSGGRFIIQERPQEFNDKQQQTQIHSSLWSLQSSEGVRRMSSNHTDKLKMAEELGRRQR